MNVRNYGIDLFKGLAMLMVVVLHILGRGGVQEACSAHSHSILYVVEEFLYVVAICAVDCFVLATGYIMSRTPFRYGRIVKLWSEVVFYSVLITVIGAMFCPWASVSIRDWIAAFFPICFDRYWFVTCYVALFFFMPFLNVLLQTLTDRGRFHLLLTGFILFACLPAVTGGGHFQLQAGYSVLWFFFLYLTGGTFALSEKRWNFLKKLKNLWLLVPLCGCAMIALGVVTSQCEKRFGFSVGYWTGYNSPFVYLEAVVGLVVFSRLTLPLWLCGCLKVIAPSVFSVYVIHSNPVFRRMIVWNGRFSSFSEYGVGGMLLATLGTALLIFSACITVDLISRSCKTFLPTYIFNKYKKGFK